MKTVFTYYLGQYAGPEGDLFIISRVRGLEGRIERSSVNNSWDNLVGYVDAIMHETLRDVVETNFRNWDPSKAQGSGDIEHKLGREIRQLDPKYLEVFQTNYGRSFCP